MTLVEISAVANAVTLVIFAASVLCGVVLLRHMAGANELHALLSLVRNFRAADVQRALAYVQSTLPARLVDPNYRAILSRPGYLDPSAHPEVVVCTWFESSAALVIGGFIDERRFIDVFGPLTTYYWGVLGPAIALMRRSRGPGQFARFEQLAARAARGGSASLLPAFPRIAIVDPFIDRVATEPAQQAR